MAYDPSAGTVRLYRRIIFRLRLTGSDMARTRALAKRYASPAFESRLAERTLNYNQNRPPATFDAKAPMGYLIVTADAYYDAMQPFVNLKESWGFDVTITRLSDIPGSGSNTDIKAYIQDAYYTWSTPPSYVLLVGDTDTIPGWNSVSAGEVTDLYYATMEGAGDWHPDVGRGRFPVRSAAQATIMVNKYLAYANLTGQEPWLKKSAFVATCDEWQIAEGTHNYVITTYTEPEGYTGIFPNNPEPGGDKLYCVTHSAGWSDLLQTSFNDGRVMLIYSGHGSLGSWEVGGYNQSDVRNLISTGVFPFVASHACVTGDFAQVEVFGETWVLQDNKGALAFWGSSDSSLWDEDDVLERAMFDSLFAETKAHADVAAMTDDGLAAVESAYPGQARYYWETYNVLGDPSVKVFLEPEPPTFTLEAKPTTHAICASGSATSTVEVSSVLGYSETVYLETSPLPAGITATIEPDSDQAPFTAALTLDVAPGAPAGDHQIVITGTAESTKTHTVEVSLTVNHAAPPAPTLLSPVHGASGVSLQPTFQWSSVPTATSYRLQVDTDASFTSPVIDVSGLTTSTYAATTALTGGTCTFWRVSGSNSCGEGAFSTVSRFEVARLGQAFWDDMESGDGQWSHAAGQGTDTWALTTNDAHSASHAWFAPDVSTVTDDYLWITTSFTATNGTTLTFWHRYNLEGTYDGGVIEASTDGGITWDDLGSYIIQNSYDYTISTAYSSPIGGRRAWSGDNGAWEQVVVDLSAYDGQDMQVRWRLACDSSVSDMGWYVDDVEFIAALPPNDFSHEPCLF
ncbi:MAG: C25 family cysteine peptidase, partial [Promethearchaeota archaeon]